MGGINSPKFQFLSSFVCDQQVYIDTDFYLCAIQQPTLRKQNRENKFYQFCEINDHTLFFRKRSSYV